MRKAEFKLQAETFSAPKYYSRGENVKHFAIYAACAYRWEDNETADPIIDDLEYFLSESEAIEYVESLKLDIGFHGQVERLIFEYDDFNEVFDFREEFDLNGRFCKNVKADIDSEVYTTDTNEGDTLDGAIIVEWSWEKYIGYCRNCISLRKGTSKDTNNSINTGNLERTWRSNESVLLNASEIEGLTDEDIADLIYDELSSESWKWNHFNKTPKRDLVEMVCTFHEDMEEEENS